MAVSCCSMSLLVKQGILFTDITNCNSMDLLLFKCTCQGMKDAVWRNFQGFKQSFSLSSFSLQSLLKYFPSYLISVALFMDTLWSCSLMGCVLHQGIHHFCQYFGLRLVRPITSPVHNPCGPQCTLRSVMSTAFLVLLRQAGTTNVCIDCEHC